ncbi:MAG: alpha/beta hydrolase [Nocardioidaceae bacterium]
MKSLSVRRLIAVTVLALVASVLAPLTAQGASARPTAPLSWGPCPASVGAPGLQCALLQVPLDYSNPGGQSIQIALSRKAHTSPDFKGVILTNPGGPGAQGRALPAYLSRAVPGNVGAKYDWIGMDIRGVGGSIPSLHCDGRYFNPRRPPNAPSTNAIMTKWLNRSRAFAQSCARSAGAVLLPHMDSQTIAKDAESVRQALGVAQLNIFGFSYGTYLAQVYATLFPGNTGKIVMDGVVDPERVWYGSNLDQEVAFNRNLNVFWRYLANHPRAFKLGRNANKIKRGYYRKLRQLTRKPMRNFGAAEFNDSLIEAGYYVFNWPSLGQAYSNFIRRNRPGGLFAAYARNNMGDDNMYAVYLAVQCTDGAWPTQQQMLADARVMHRRSPFMAWSNTWYNAPCLTWPAPIAPRAAVNGAGLSQNVLLISETLDAATPFSGALRAKQLFPTASLIEGVGGTTHAGSLSGVACVDKAIATYLESGAVPARGGGGADLRCPRIPPPTP